MPRRVYSRIMPVMVKGLFAGVSLMTVAGAQAVPVVNDIAPSPGSTWTYATGVSATGVWACGYNDISTRAFRWIAPNSTQNLGLPPGSTLWSYGQAISDDGTSVAGWCDTPGASRAWRWQSNAFTVLQPVPGGSTCAAFAINGNGSFVAGQSDGPGFPQRAARWQVGVGVISLGVLPGGTNSYAYGMDDSGNVVVGNSTSANGTRAFRWVSPGPMVDLGVLPAQSASGATAVSSNGNVVVGGSGTQAFRWVAPGPMVDIGAASVYAVSGDGKVVGGTQGGNAALWSQNAGWRNLNTWLPSIGANTANWTFASVRGISADGSTIVGDGTFFGTPRAYRITGLPCPDVPVITLNPTNQSLCQGQDYGAYAEASVGFGPYTFQWRRNGVPINMGNTAWGSQYIMQQPTPERQKLTIFIVQPQDAASYDCVITNACGSTTTVAGVVTVNTPPTVSGFSFGQFVCVGSTVGIGSSFNSTLPLTYTWYKGSTLLSNGLQASGSTISGQGTANLTITDIQPQDGATYVCVAANACSGATASFTQDILVGGGIDFDQQPLGFSTCPGGGGSMTALASGATSYQWQFKTYTGQWVNIASPFYIDFANGIIFSVSNANTPTLNIGSINPGPMVNFAFRCVVGVSFGCPGVSSEAVVFVAPTPTITQHPQNVLGCAGDTQTFSVGWTSPINQPIALFWQVLDGTNNWVPLLDGLFTDPSTGMGFTVSGAGMPTISISGLTLGTHSNPVKIRCQIGGLCNLATSNVADYTVKVNRCSPADIAWDDGFPLPPFTSCMSLAVNTGVNEGDYNCFFSASGFFYLSSIGPAAIGSPCDIAYDDGTALPPFDFSSTAANNGVNEGDYNCFFNYLFLGCP